MYGCVFGCLFTPQLTAVRLTRSVSSMSGILHHFAAGPVVKGFGRGSKELGIPTANFPEDVVSHLPSSVANGIYYGLAKVTDGPVHKMVMSIGWNPFYKNSKKSMETHILQQFSQDFYGSWLRVLVLGYIRPEKNFSSLDELIDAIKEDINTAERELSHDRFASYPEHVFFQLPEAEVQKEGVVQSFNAPPTSSSSSSDKMINKQQLSSDGGGSPDSNSIADKSNSSNKGTNVCNGTTVASNGTR